MRRHAVVPILALALLVTGCATRAVPGTPQADPIVRVANALDKISIAAAAGVDVTALLKLPIEQRAPILRAFERLVEARIAAGGIVRDLNRLDTLDKSRLASLLQPAFKAFRDSSTLALLGIKSADAQAKVRVYVGIIDTALMAIEITLAWRN